MTSTMHETSESEEERLQALASYAVLDTAPEPEFDEITRLAALVLAVPSSAISLVDDRRQWFKARTGIPFTETPRSQAFCSHAVASGEFLEVTDATEDARFADNPLVTAEGGIRFYAGAPLIVETGHCLGTLCVFDSITRQPLSAAQRQALQDLAALAVERIEARKARLQSEIAAKVVSATSDAVLAVGRDGVITFWNIAAEQMFGHPAASAIGSTLDLILPLGLAQAHHRGFARAVGGGKTHLIGTTVELAARRASGEEFPIELSLARWNDNRDQNGGGFAAIVRDVSSRKALERDLADARLFLTSIVTHIPAMLFVKDAATREYLLLNKAGEDIIGKAATEIVGRTDADLFAGGNSYHERDTSVLNSAGVESHESEFTRPDGRAVRLRTKRVVIDAPEARRKYILGLSEDVTELRRTEARVLHLALHDSLTGIANRSSFVERLATQVDAGQSLAVLTIDLDRFKAVNDQFGHLAGDQLLIEVANRLRRIIGDEDFVARIGGDEFTIVAVAEDPMERARHIADEVVASLGEPYEVSHFVVHAGASVGVVISPDDGVTVEQLRNAADLALYRAKAKGRGTICFFNDEMDQAARERRVLERDLRHAIECGQIHLVYQPVISSMTGQVTSFEALARWTHPEFGPISPEIFIGIAEECGLIVPLGSHVMAAACNAAAAWRQDLRIAVNLSPLQFESHDLVETVRNVLSASALPPNRLQLEVTEGLLIRDVENTFRVLSELRSLGVQILLDDFGVGYSSLSYFERFPFDKVKVDRSFVRKMATTPAAKAIIEAVVGLGQTLGMGIVAEGVETAEQMEMLIALGCTHLQGYLFSEPKGEAAFSHILSRGGTNSVQELRRLSYQG